MMVDLRTRIEEWLAVLASDAEVQLRAVQGLPEELRLAWEDCYSMVDDRNGAANLDALAQFSAAERAELDAFNAYLWSLPPEPDPMWDSAALNDEPWPQVRARASLLLARLSIPAEGRPDDERA